MKEKQASKFKTTHPPFGEMFLGIREREKKEIQGERECESVCVYVFVCLRGCLSMLRCL